MSRRARERAGPRQPRPVYANAVQRAIEGARLLPKVETAAVKAGMRMALTEFLTGKRCDVHWATLADALNMAESLSDIGICSDEPSAEKINAGQLALAEVAQQFARIRSWTLRAAQLDALRTGLEIHEIQLDYCSFSEYERAYHTTRNRISQARAGNAGPGVVVVGGVIGATS